MNGSAPRAPPAAVDSNETDIRYDLSVRRGDAFNRAPCYHGRDARRHRPAHRADEPGAHARDGRGDAERLRAAARSRALRPERRRDARCCAPYGKHERQRLGARVRAARDGPEAATGRCSSSTAAVSSAATSAWARGPTTTTQACGRCARLRRHHDGVPAGAGGHLPGRRGRHRRRAALGARQHRHVRRRSGRHRAARAIGRRDPRRNVRGLNGGARPPRRRRSRRDHAFGESSISARSAGWRTPTPIRAATRKRGCGPRRCRPSP